MILEALVVLFEFSKLLSLALKGFVNLLLYVDFNVIDVLSGIFQLFFELISSLQSAIQLKRIQIKDPV